MNCFECAKAGDTVPAAGICRHCGVGLCPDHLVEADRYRVGGTRYGCGHELSRAERRRGVPAGVAAAARHDAARVS